MDNPWKLAAQEKRLTQFQISQQTGLSVTTVNRVLNEHPNTNPVSRVAIAYLLGLDVEWARKLNYDSHNQKVIA